MAVSGSTVDQVNLRDFAAIDLFTSEASRQRVLGDLAPTAVAFELHRWRDAVRGDREQELNLLWLLHSGLIGVSKPNLSVADQLEERLGLLPALPRDLDPAQLDEKLDAALTHWAAKPSDVSRGQKYFRLRVVLGGTSSNVSVSPLRVWFDSEMACCERPSLSTGETLQLLVGVARAIAGGDNDPSLRAYLDVQLRESRSRFGELVAADADAESIEDDGVFALATPGDGHAFFPTLLEDSRKVIGLLLRYMSWVSAEPRDGVWLGWTTEPLRLPVSSMWEKWRKRATGWSIAIAFSLLFALPALLLPHSISGSLPVDQLVQRASPPCSSCPDQERVTAVGFRESDNQFNVDVRLAAPPKDTSLALSFQGLSSKVIAINTEGAETTWKFGVNPPGDIPNNGLLVQSQGTEVVFTVPNTIRPSAVAVTTGSGDRFPASGFIPLQPEPPANVNLVDVAIAGSLLLAAWRGLKGGFLSIVPSLVGSIVTILVGRLFYQPIGSLVVGWMGAAPRFADAVALALITAVVGIVVFIAASTFAATALSRLKNRLSLTIGATMDAAAGAVLSFVRSSWTVATILIFAVDLVFVIQVREMVTTSLLGRAFISAWRVFYPGL